MAQSSSRWLIGLLIGLVVPTTLAGEPEPLAGKLLVAGRGLVDPNFHQTVVLVVRHDSVGGAMGLVLNRPTANKPSDLLPEVRGLERRSDALHWGGPVELDTVTMLIGTAAGPTGSRPVLPGVFVSQDGSLLRQLASDTAGAFDLRLYGGYAGWAPGQLEAEIARGDWRIFPANASLVFAEDSSGLWWRLVPPSPRDMTDASLGARP